jgi:RNA polymerase sigma-70 factor (ECF subfamily)
MVLSMENPRTNADAARSSEPEILAEILVEQHYAYLYRLAASILDDPAEADDAVQETILRALAHWQQIPSARERRGWLTVLAVNHCRDRLRRRKTRQAVTRILQTLQHPGASTTVEDQVMQNQHRSELQLALQGLDEKHRLPVILRFGHGMNAGEIARALNISEGTVYSRLHYAIRKLRQELGPAFEQGGQE